MISKLLPSARACSEAVLLRKHNINLPHDPFCPLNLGSDDGVGSWASLWTAEEDVTFGRKTSRFSEEETEPINYNPLPKGDSWQV